MNHLDRQPPAGFPPDDAGPASESPLDPPPVAHWALDCGLPGKASTADGDDPPPSPHPHDANLEQLLPPEPSDPPDLLAGKLPRRLHLWFALGLGVMATLALGAQALLARWWPAPTAPAPAVAASMEPSLTTLQRELARQKGGASTPGFGKLPSSNPPAGGVMATALAGTTPPATGAARPLPLPTLPPLDPVMPDPASAAAAEDGGLPEQLLGVPATAAAGHEDAPGSEHLKSQALAAGSRILALDHASHASVFGETGDPLAGGSPGSGHGQQLAELLQAAPALLQHLPELLAVGGRALGAGASAADGALAATAGGRPAVASPVPETTAAVLTAGAPPPQPVIQEGTPIACVLLTEIRSDLPGMIVAQVTEDVYDSVTAQRRMIPRGTRLVGHYDSQVSAGQQRLLASFHRLILPDGASVELQHMDAADQVGGAGLHDQVDTHFWQRFGQAFLTAGLARAAQRDSVTGYTTAQGGVLPGPDASGQILVDTARGSLQSSASIAPTLVIRRGTVFNVMVNRDLALPVRAPS